MVTMAGTRTALALLGHDGLESGPRPVAPRRSRLRVVAVALRTRPTSLAIPGPPPPAPEPVLPSPPVSAGAAAVLLEAGVPPADLRRAAGMCPELLSVPAEAVEAALRFLTEEAGVPAPDLPRVLRRRPRLLVSPVAARLRPTLYFLRALGVPDLHRRADLLSFSVEDKLLPRIEFPGGGRVQADGAALPQPLTPPPAQQRRCVPEPTRHYHGLPQDNVHVPPCPRRLRIEVTVTAAMI